MSLFGGYVVLNLVLYLSIPLYANVDENSIASARIESCKGCRLNHLPAVKAFVYEDIPLYEHVSFKPIPGASPVVIFSNKFDQELERIDLAPLSREACNALLADRGFRKKSETVKEREDF